MNDSATRTDSVAQAVETAQVDAEHPWLGLASFSEETQRYFYGREDEVAELARRVQRKTLTLLFGQSGLGKTSILSAGIVPRLRGLGYCPVYVRIDYAASAPAPSEQIKGAIFRATGASGEWAKPGVSVAGESLWEFLHHRGDVLRDVSGEPLIPLLIFDQFEEIFTLAQSDDSGRARAAEFIDDLADLVENRPPKALEAAIDADDSVAERFDFARTDYRVLIALREDYLAQLESVKGRMPSVTQNRMRLARMTGEQALAAVTKPGGRLVTDEVAEAIVRFVAGGSELRNAEVEPSLLSLICRELNNARLAQHGSEISAALLAGSRDTILSEFYERALTDQPEGVRRFIEDELLTESGFRESVAEERVQKAFAGSGAPQALAALVNRRLLRVEERLDLRRVELTHDVLCAVVRTSRSLRQEREARDEAERKLAEQKAREAATHRALVRARQVAAVCIVLAIAAIGSAVFGYVSMKRAQRAEVAAKETRALADNARGQAEKLIVYLLDDFYRELEPIGRLDIVASLAKRAVDYYADLPAALRTPETDRNRALALVRYGAALRYQSKLTESKQALSDAVATLTRLRAQGDRSEETAIGLAIGLASQAKLASSELQIPDELKLSQQSVEVLAPLMKAPSPSVAVRRAYGLATTYLGFSQMQTGDNEAAVKTLDQARDALRSIADLKLDDTPAAVAYAEASSWQAGTLNGLGRFDRARTVAQDALDVTAKVLAVQPGNMLARRAQALTFDNLVSAESAEMHMKKALEWSTKDVAGWQAMTELDPTNQVSWNNLVNARMQAAGVRYSLGDIDGALAELRAGVDVAKHVRDAAFLGQVLAQVSGWFASGEADSGHERAAAAALAQNRRYTDMATTRLPAGSFGRGFLPEYLGTIGPGIGLGVGYAVFAMPYATGDFATVHAMALAVANRLEPLTPPENGAKEGRDSALCLAWRTAAEASWWQRDFASAGREIDKALEACARVPLRSVGDRRNRNVLLTLQAWIAAGSGDTRRAATIIEPVLAFERDLFERKDNEDLTQYIEYAQALYASALATPKTASASLAEAARILDRLPAPMRSLHSTARLRAAIAAAGSR
jgi:tetratricopeptide (TPR) repeat protein